MQTRSLWLKAIINGINDKSFLYSAMMSDQSVKEIGQTLSYACYFLCCINNKYCAQLFCVAPDWFLCLDMLY